VTFYAHVEEIIIADTKQPEEKREELSSPPCSLAAVDSRALFVSTPFASGRIRRRVGTSILSSQQTRR
jgi:hypothetical protein